MKKEEDIYSCTVFLSNEHIFNLYGSAKEIYEKLKVIKDNLWRPLEPEFEVECPVVIVKQDAVDEVEVFSFEKYKECSIFLDFQENVI